MWYLSSYKKFALVVMGPRRSTIRLHGMVISGECGSMSGLFRVRFAERSNAGHGDRVNIRQRELE